MAAATGRTAAAFAPCGSTLRSSLRFEADQHGSPFMFEDRAFARPRDRDTPRGSIRWQGNYIDWWGRLEKEKSNRTGVPPTD